MTHELISFLLAVAEGLDEMPRVNQITPDSEPVIVMKDSVARMLADRARALSKPPRRPAPILTMPSPVSSSRLAA
jgi:hypothetical protein